MAAEIFCNTVSCSLLSGRTRAQKITVNFCPKATSSARGGMTELVSMGWCQQGSHTKCHYGRGGEEGGGGRWNNAGPADQSEDNDVGI